jgi:predicted DsbA family dithiol-disulfide isomerase
MTARTATESSTRLTVDVWADVLCPWCYLGEHRLQAAIERSGLADRIDVSVHTFELAPHAGAEVVPALEYLAAEKGVSAGRARAMERHMADLAAAEGLPYAIDRPVANSNDMLRLVHLGAEHGRGWAYLRAMQAAVFSGDFRSFEPATLIRLGGELGIPADRIRDVLESDRYAAAVRADRARALELGARGVPFTVLGGRLGIPGAVGTAEYAAAIEQAWEQVNG